MAGWFIILEFDMCGSVQGMCRTHMCLQVWMIEVACVCLPICAFMESGWISELQHSSSSSSKGLKRRRMIKCHECPCLLFYRGESSESFPFWIIPHHTHTYSLSARTTVPCRFKNRKKSKHLLCRLKSTLKKNTWLKFRKAPQGLKLLSIFLPSINRSR